MLFVIGASTCAPGRTGRATVHGDFPPVGGLAGSQLFARIQSSHSRGHSEIGPSAGRPGEVDGLEALEASLRASAAEIRGTGVEGITELDQHDQRYQQPEEVSRRAPGKRS